MTDISYQKTSYLKQLWWKIKRIPRRFEKGNYEKHALREFEYAGWVKDGKWDDEMQELMCKQVISLLRLFGKHGHSGSSAPYAANLFKKLAAFEPIGAITCEDHEWNILEDSDKVSYQNKRLSSVFKESKEGKPYYLNAIVWKEKDGTSFTGKVEDIRSRQFIRLPFYPKTFYIDILRTKVLDGSTGDRVVECGDGSYIYSIKDRRQLEKVTLYYDMEAI